MRFTVLASGSAGNSSLLESEGFSLLIDLGLGPRLLSRRLSAAGASWAGIQAAVLTHTHSDHWAPTTLAHLARHRITLYCHRYHAARLVTACSAFLDLQAAGLLRYFEADEVLQLSSALTCRPLPLAHDGGPTFGFRFEEAGDLFGTASAMGYVADLGSWTDNLIAALADVDLLALEFNHDVALEQASGRSAHLIARVLGERGHLSNGQAASLVRELRKRSSPGRLKYLIQLHLSRDCNRPALARAAVQQALCDEDCIVIHTADQHRGSPTICLGPDCTRRLASRPRGMVRNLSLSKRLSPLQRPLPGLED